MKFRPFPLQKLQKTSRVFRFLEMIPAILLWVTFLGTIILSFIKPIWVIYFIIVYAIFFIIRIYYFLYNFIASWFRFRSAIKTDWFKLLKEKFPQWKDYYQIIYLPMYTETYDVLKSTFGHLQHCQYDQKKMIIVLGGEGRAGENFRQVAAQVKENFEGVFHHILFTEHPDGLEGEIKGKGSNANWMGKRSKELIDELGLDYDKLIVSYFDCDTSVHPQYFAHLTYKYLSHSNPTRSSYQPVVLYNNNMWDSPGPMRVAAFSTTMWLLGELMRPERLYTFSSHSMSFRALVDVEFWAPDIVTDDTRIFLHCFMHYNGDYGVTPLYIPVSMDTVLGESWWVSFKNLYKQQRRWAWGVEHFPYMVWEFWHRPKIALKKKIHYLFNLMEGMYLWASGPILMFILGYLPLYIQNTWYKKDFMTGSAFVQNAPFALEKIMLVGMLGILLSAFIFLVLLPKRPERYSPWKYLFMLLQWILLPVVMIVFGSIPATESQTRLMLGKYLGFWVTPKVRKE
ncbi:MAG TPA: glycosyltransferase family 2 protein [bacterium]|nr:glycosyltransferase family 2 protein [bacterium]